MARINPSDSTVKALFAKSGNQCAFPECSQPLISNRNDAIGQMCHIEAASAGGPRFNEDTSPESRASYENLILLCYAHHIEIDKHPDDYPAHVLRTMKESHESRFIGREIEVSPRVIEQARENQLYWDGLQRKSKELVEKLELHLEVDSSLSIDELFQELRETIGWIRGYIGRARDSDEAIMADLELLCKEVGVDFSRFEQVHYTENPFFSRNWEMHNLGGYNAPLKLDFSLMQLDVKVLELRLSIDPDNQHCRNRLKESRSELENFVETACYSD